VAYVDLASDGFLLIGRPNAVPNPCALLGVTEWVENSYPSETVDRVTDPGVALPAGATTCIHNAPAEGGSMLVSRTFPLPDGVASGDWLWVQFAVYCTGGDPADYTLLGQIEFLDSEHGWLEAITLCDYVEAPSAGFHRYAFSVQVPETDAAFATLVLDTEGVSLEEPYQLADLAHIYVTQVLVEPGREDVLPPDYSENLAGLLSDSYRDLSSDGGIRLHGEADLFVSGGYVDLESDGGVTLGGSARLNVGRVLPQTVWSWTTPLSRGELLRTLRVRLATRDGEYTIVDPTEFEDISIELTRKGGVDVMTFVLARDARLELGDLDYKTDCDVDYLGRQLQAWVRESSLDHGAQGMRRTVTLLGWIARLKEEHEAFRKVYVDSRLSVWKTDQGSLTDSQYYEVSQDEDGNVGINVMGNGFGGGD